jgi:pimeloyl-ACP methyl ester carboxylesterase
MSTRYSNYYSGAWWRWRNMRRTVVALLLMLNANARAAPASDHPVAAIADARLAITTELGQGILPLYVSPNWTRPLPEVTRALVLIHGTLRNADDYLRIARSAVSAAGASGRGTLVVVPQFLATPDATAYNLPNDVLRWSVPGWIDGDAAEQPSPISSFAAMDAILARFADTTEFPNLRTVVIAGHSAGAQLVQRYAVVGRAAMSLRQPALALRYVVANPSSYLWFGDDRPTPMNVACPTYNRWKYGLADVPPYVRPTEQLEERYIQRDVIYLLGERDTDPDHRFLDKSCAAEAQGPTRYSRGMNFLLNLEQRHPNLVRHRIFTVWGVGHDATRMFTSTCGLAALFDRPGCLGF